MDYESEAEEGLGLKHGKLLAEDEESEEDEELEEDLEEEGEEGPEEELEGEEGAEEEGEGGEEGTEDMMDEDLGSTASLPMKGLRGRPAVESSGPVDFEKDVLAKTVKTKDNMEICPYCKKPKPSVARHISSCKRAPPEAVAAYNIFKSKKGKSAKKTKEADSEDEE